MWGAAGWGASLLALALGLGGPALGQALQADAPERLAAQAAGVVGSGDRLSLKLNTPKGERILRLGETYEDGWTLKALDPSKATLVRQGASREIRLNPTGALAIAAQAGPSSSVTVAGIPDEDAVRRIFEAAGPRVMPPTKVQTGLTLAETRRLTAYSVLTGQEQERRRTAGLVSLSPPDVIALLGQAAYDDRMALIKKSAAAAQSAIIDDLAARPVTGPTSFYVAAGANAAQVIVSQGIDYRGIWDPGPADAQGGRTFTLTAGTAEQYTQRMATGLSPIQYLVPGMVLQRPPTGP